MFSIVPRFLTTFVVPRKWKFGFVQLLHVACTGLVLVPPLIVRYVIDTAIPSGDFTLVVFASLGFAGLWALWAALTSLREYVGHEVAQRITSRLRNDLYGHFQKLSMTFHDNKKTGELISRLVDDINVIEEFTHHGPETLITSVVLLVGSLGLMFYMDWRLALIGVAVVPVLLLLGRAGAQRIVHKFREVTENKASLANVLEENIAGMRVIQGFGREDREAQAVADANEVHYRGRMELIRWVAFLFPVSLFVNNLAVAGVLLYGGYRIMDGDLNVGALMAFLMYLGHFLDPIRRLMFMIEQGGRFLAGIERFFDYMDIEPDIQDKPGATALEKVHGEVRFDDVHFGYDRETVLNGVDLVAKPGQMVALVGPSGAGKTTIIRLIGRFYDPFQGQVLVDGHDVRDLQLRSLRAHMAAVMQDDFLFSGRVCDNISYGRPDATQAEVVDAARLANAHAFIEQLPEGYETEIGKRGVKLSEGQRQRISIARAILKDPQILLLDEATSSVDSETEYMIQQAIEHLRAGRTTFVIAHRLSTILEADQILFVENGTIVERGTHEELLKKNGQYARFYSIQFERAVVG